MMLSIVVLAILSLVVAEAKGAQCKGKERLIQLNFEDLTLGSPDYDTIPVPYYGFVIRRGSIGNYLGPIFLMNTSFAENINWKHAASTPPNIIFSDHQPLYLRYNSTRVNDEAFTLLNFTVAPIWWYPMPIAVETFRRGSLVNRQDLIIQGRVATTVVVEQTNIDLVLVTATGGPNNDIPYGNRHLAYDTFMLCQQ